MAFEIEDDPDHQHRHHCNSAVDDRRQHLLQEMLDDFCEFCSQPLGSCNSLDSRKCTDFSRKIAGALAVLFVKVELT